MNAAQGKIKENEQNIPSPIIDANRKNSFQSPEIDLR